MRKKIYFLGVVLITTIIFSLTFSTAYSYYHPGHSYDYPSYSYGQHKTTYTTSGKYYEPTPYGLKETKYNTRISTKTQPYNYHYPYRPTYSYNYYKPIHYSYAGPYWAYEQPYNCYSGCYRGHY